MIGPKMGKSSGIPNQPAPMAKTDNSTKGIVMNQLLSWACSASGVRGLPKKVMLIWRVV
jgi:hypothetical protein